MKKFEITVFDRRRKTAYIVEDASVGTETEHGIIEKSELAFLDPDYRSSNRDYYDIYECLVFDEEWYQQELETEDEVDRDEFYSTKYYAVRNDVL